MKAGHVREGDGRKMVWDKRRDEASKQKSRLPRSDERGELGSWCSGRGAVQYGAVGGFTVPSLVQ